MTTNIESPVTSVVWVISKSLSVYRRLFVGRNSEGTAGNRIALTICGQRPLGRSCYIPEENVTMKS